jgi:isochorismate synthase
VLDHRLLLYVGGGITMESVPEAEWEETELKANTLLAVIQKL